MPTPPPPTRVPGRWPPDEDVTATVQLLLAAAAVGSRGPDPLALRGARMAVGGPVALPIDALARRVEGAGRHPFGVRATLIVRRARRLAGDLVDSVGAHPRLAKLIALLDDGIVRDIAAARQLLAASGAGEWSDPRDLHRIAGWLQHPVGWNFAPGKGPSGDLGGLVGRHGDVHRAGSALRVALRQVGVLPVDAIAGWDDPVVHLASGARISGLAVVEGRWLVAHGDTTSRLARTLRRLVAVLGPVLLDDLPDALARTQTRSRPVPHWPPPPDAMRVWVEVSRGWVVDARGYLHVDEPGPPRDVDVFLRSVLEQGGAGGLGHTRLREVYVAGGRPAHSANFTMVYSPLLRQRSRASSYQLLRHL